MVGFTSSKQTIPGGNIPTVSRTVLYNVILQAYMLFEVWILAVAPLTGVKLVTSSALQSRKWQLIANGAAAHYVAIHCQR